MKMGIFEFTIAAIVLVLLGIFHNGWWLAGFILLISTAIFNKLAYKRWPWTPRKRIKVGKKEISLVEGSMTFLPCEFYTLCKEEGSGAMRAPISGMKELIQSIKSDTSPYEKNRNVAILHRTQLKCAKCGCRISDDYQNSLWVNEAKNDYVVIGQGSGTGKMPTSDFRCPKCKNAEGLYIYNPVK